MKARVIRTDDEWRHLLTAEQFRVLRRAGTEAAFSGRYTDLQERGTYACAGCGAALFDSQDKYHSGCGWPSFTRPVDSDAVTEHADVTFGMTRVEVRCSSCEGHLGHVFEDGPPPLGRRYCINSVSLQFIPVR
jgi:peptide-methionine (R)-S-oxide reductase